MPKVSLYLLYKQQADGNFRLQSRIQLTDTSLIDTLSELLNIKVLVTFESSLICFKN